METDLVELTSLVVTKAGTETLLSRLGEVTEKQRAGLLVKPGDARFSTAQLVFDEATLPHSQEVRFVDLVLQAGSDLKLTYLTERFGAWTKVPPAPSGALFKVRFKYEKKEGPDIAFVYVTLSGEPADAKSFVTEILIYRDERL